MCDRVCSIVDPMTLRILPSKVEIILTNEELLVMTHIWSKAK